MFAQKVQLNSTQESFFRDGFAIVKKAYPANDIANLSRLLNEIKRVATGFSRPTLHNNSYYVMQGQAIQRVVWCCGEKPEIGKYSNSSQLLEPVSKLLRSNEFDHLICQVHYKIPGDNVAFDWHQDSQHRGFGTWKWQDLNGVGSFVQTLLAIDPMTPENGPLRYYKGSHQLGHLALDQSDDPEKYFHDFELVSLEMDPGDLIFFHPFLIHGSSPNFSSKERRVLINGFAYPGANHFSYPGAGKGVRVTTRKATS